MGTSQGYSAPPSWGPVKRQVTSAAKSGHVSRPEASRIVGEHIRANGGPGSVARTGGVLGGGRAAQDIAGRLGSFIADVSASGISHALQNIGLGGLVNGSVAEILAGLTMFIGGPASTIDEVDARNALASLHEKIMADAESLQDVQEVFEKQGEQIELLLQDFFGFYIYEQFCRVYFEHLMQRVGEDKATSFLENISDYIQSALRNHAVDRDLSNIQWNGSEGRGVITAIMQGTLEVFGGSDAS